MTTGQKVPAGYYVSNSKDEDVFFVDTKGNYYFKKETGRSGPVLTSGTSITSAT